MRANFEPDVQTANRRTPNSNCPQLSPREAVHYTHACFVEHPILPNREDERSQPDRPVEHAHAHVRLVQQKTGIVFTIVIIKTEFD